MKKTPDLTYITIGIYTRFFPETDAGKIAWLTMAKDDGVAAIYSCHTDNVLRQLRKAGYSVAKAKPSTMSIDDILAELEA